ncbi:MAG: 3-hydroxyacyl-[acyl-carrier-protein] dehydratase [Bacteroidia bacterium]|jgi:3-hydroxyacyl-[acyl-carrier-protein] dehydratase
MMATLAGFYTKLFETTTENGWNVSVELNSNHKVYEGHFPGKPVAPGAALTQMVLDEVASRMEEKHLVELRQIKFLSVIDPTQVSNLDLVFEIKERNGLEMFTCLGKTETTNYFKLNGIFG